MAMSLPSPEDRIAIANVPRSHGTVRSYMETSARLFRILRHNTAHQPPTIALPTTGEAAPALDAPTHKAVAEKKHERSGYCFSLLDLYLPVLSQLNRFHSPARRLRAM